MKKNMDVSHKKLKHQRRGVTVVNCDGHSRTPGSVQEPGVRPGAREESSHIRREFRYIYYFFLTVLHMSLHCHTM